MSGRVKSGPRRSSRLNAVSNLVLSCRDVIMVSDRSDLTDRVRGTGRSNCRSTSTDLDLSFTVHFYGTTTPDGASSTCLYTGNENCYTSAGVSRPGPHEVAPSPKEKNFFHEKERFFRRTGEVPRGEESVFIFWVLNTLVNAFVNYD